MVHYWPEKISCSASFIESCERCYSHLNIESRTELMVNMLQVIELHQTGDLRYVKVAENYRNKYKAQRVLFELELQAQGEENFTENLDYSEVLLVSHLHSLLLAYYAIAEHTFSSFYDAVPVALSQKETDWLTYRFRLIDELGERLAWYEKVIFQGQCPTEVGSGSMFDRVRAYGILFLPDLLGSLFVNEGDDADSVPTTNFELYFRGQKDESWGLVPSLVRCYPPKEEFLSAAEYEKYLTDLEVQMVAGAYSKGLVRNLGSVEVLSILQHHGVPTRLLDVSADWRVALFFACEPTGQNANGRIYLFRVPSSQRWEYTPWNKVSQKLLLKRLDLSNVDLGSGGMLDCLFNLPMLKRDVVLPWHHMISAVVPSGSSLNHEASEAKSKGIGLLKVSRVDPRMISQEGSFIVGAIGGNSCGRDSSDWINQITGISSFAVHFARPKKKWLRNKRSTLVSLRPDRLVESLLGNSYSGITGASIVIPANLKPSILALLESDPFDPLSIKDIYPRFGDLKEEFSSLLKDRAAEPPFDPQISEQILADIMKDIID